MRRPLRSRTRRTPAEDPEINRALEAMSAPELRAAVHAVLDVLDADVKAHIIDTLIVRATKARLAGGPTAHPSELSMTRNPLRTPRAERAMRIPRT